MSKNATMSKFRFSALDATGSQVSGVETAMSTGAALGSDRKEEHPQN